MSDSAGKQGMAISSQKDLNASTGNDKNETVAVNDDHSIGKAPAGQLTAAHGA